MYTLDAKINIKMGLMRQSYGIPCVPLYRPILCVHPIPCPTWDLPVHWYTWDTIELSHESHIHVGQWDRMDT